MQAEPASSTDEFARLHRVTDDLLTLLEALPGDALRQPTRCAPMTVKDLAAHVGGSLFFARAWIDEQPEGATTMDRVTMWRSFPEGVEDRVLADALARSDAVDDVVDELREEANALFDRAASEDADRAVGYTGFCMPLRDMLACRVLEVAVHTLDVQSATGQVEKLSPAAEPIVRQILDGLLGQTPDVDWDITAYALTGTGRQPLSDDEATRLGSLAGLFPLLR